jgi:hypothetical protein
MIMSLGASCIEKLNGKSKMIPSYIGRSIESVFGSVVAGAFQITFRVKIHVNDVFLFFKNYF